MSLETRALARIESDFSEAERAKITALLETYRGHERDRVVWDILHLSAGKLEAVKQYLAAAQRDYRDVLYWAEYYKDDPLVRGRDPRQLAQDLLRKLGKNPSDDLP
jgi:hypothetical protein